MFVLIDGKVGPKENDLQLVEWLQYNRIPYSVIATKVDKISKNAGASLKREIRKLLPDLTNKSTFLFSAKDRTGREELLSYIEDILQ